MGTTEAQRLIAVSLGKIAMSRQQRGGINLHKNLLVASVLHKARTTYMMDNFQVLLANKKAQAEKEAAAKMVTEVTHNTEQKANVIDTKQAESMDVSRGVTACSRINGNEAQNGERVERRVMKSADKENMVPSTENSTRDCEQLSNKSCVRDSAPIVTGKVPLSSNNGTSDYVSNAGCRCSSGKRRRSFVETDSGTLAKKARFEEDSDSDCESDFDTKDGYESMHTEPSQVNNLVDIFNSGFNGLYRSDNEESSSDDNISPKTGHLNVYVNTDRQTHQFVLKDMSCATQLKDNVTVPTAIALAV